jgi:hypothetical protein
MHVLEPDPGACSCPGEGLHWYFLIMLHAINLVIVCSFICTRSLACDEGTRLNYCDVISTAGELAMTIIMMDKLYIILSY